jgi:glucose-6-phosphate isomerase
MPEPTYGPRTAAWQSLTADSSRLRQMPIAELFERDPARHSRCSITFDGLVLDFSRQLVDTDTISHLVDLARQTEVPRWIELMFAGFPVNNTEDRPALHIALRRETDAPFIVAGEDVAELVRLEREKMRQLVDALHHGALRGYGGKPITDVVNVGIGGSDLGIAMAVSALAEDRRRGIELHFVSNIDGVALAHVLASVDPETTLFVICSKSFTTLETIVNAQAVRAWLMEAGGLAAVAAQCIAVSTNHEAMDAFGIAPDRRLAMWDWVGGRFSLWSAVGLVIAFGIGWEKFSELLAGGAEMDEHFRTAPLEQNLPVIAALLGIWNRNFLGGTSHVVLPYDDHLARFPAYLQQLEMESNGKSVRRGGEPVECATCPIIWGEPGSNAQHSFLQLLHQGTERLSIDFLLPARSRVGRQEQQDLAAANCLAQAWALADGNAEGARRGSPHRHYPGNRPSSLFLFASLDPRTLGRLVALYEHKVFVQGVIWDVNSFDQWGVQLGKSLASRLSGFAEHSSGEDPLLVRGALDELRSLRG